MPRGRKPKADPSVPQEVQIPGSLWAEVKLRLPFDPATNKTKHGAFSALIERLLREALAQGRIP